MITKCNHFLRSFLFAVIAVFLLLPSVAVAATYSRIVAFGDSLSDHGGLKEYFGLYDPVSNVLGVHETWSNGNVWLDYLRTDLEVTVENNAIAGAMTHGHEEASIQALSDSGNLPQLGIDGQINSYIAANAAGDYSDTLFSIWIGGNDLLEYNRGESAYGTPETLIYGSIQTIVTSMESLYQKGARKFLVLNLPDVGKAPVFGNSTEERKIAATMLSSLFNQSLWTKLDSLKTAHPDIIIIKFDVFTYINQVLTSGIFPNITSSYVAYDVYGYPTGSYNEPASDYFFWDLIHPTTKAHELLAKEVAVKIKQSFTDDSDTDDNSDNGSSDGSSGSSCFIDSASEMSFGSNSDVLIFVFSAGFFVAAFLSCRRNNS